jgi:WD40 repeat protein
MIANPYVGPRPFETKDMDRFYGRVREIADLKSLIMAQAVVIIYAESGAGKSSLVNAGLIPRLQSEGFDVLPAARVRGALAADFPVENVRNIYALNVLLSLAGKRGDAGQLATETIAGYLENRSRGQTNGAPSLARLLILDQFEELFTGYGDRWADRRAFFWELAEIFKSRDERGTGRQQFNAPTKILIVMREDYIAHLDPYVDILPDRMRTRYRLERLRKEAAIDAVGKPVEKTGRRYDERAAEALVNKLQWLRQRTERGTVAEVPGEFVEPVQLQVVCHRLWDALPPETKLITIELVERYSNVDNALSEFYEKTIAAAVAHGMGDGSRQRGLARWLKGKIQVFHQNIGAFAAPNKPLFIGRLRRWFEKKLMTANGIVAAVTSHMASGGRPQRWLYCWLNERLKAFRQYTVAVTAPNKLIFEGRLRRWFEEKLITPNGTRGTVFEGTNETEGIPNKVVSFLADEHLLRGDWRAGGIWYEITHDRFIEPIRISNRSWFGHWRKLRLRAAAIAAFIGFLTVVTSAFISTSQRDRALTLSQLLALNQLTATARDRLNSQPDVGVLLSVAAFTASDTAETRGALLNATMEIPQIDGYLSGVGEPTAALAFAGDRVISVGASGERKVWDLGSKKLIESRAIRKALAFALSRNGRVFAALGEDDIVAAEGEGVSATRIALRDKETDRVGRFEKLVLSYDGTYAVATASCKDRIISPPSATPKGQRSATSSNRECPGFGVVLDIAAGMVVDRFDIKAPPTAIAVSDDGALIAVGRCRSALELDLAARALGDLPVAGVGDLVPSVVGDSVDDSGSSCRGVLEFYDRPNKQFKTESVITLGAAFRSIVFGSDGRLAFAGDDRAIQLKRFSSDFKDVQATSIDLGSRAVPSALAYDDDGQRLISGTETGLLTIFNLTDRVPPGFELVTAGSKTASEQALARIAISDDGTLVATGSLDKKIRVWKAGPNGYNLVVEQMADGMLPLNVSLSADGAMVAAANFDTDSPPSKRVDTTAIVWAVADGRRQGTLSKMKLANVDGVSAPSKNIRSVPPDPTSSTLSDQTKEVLLPGVASIAFAKDGRLLLGSDVGNLLIWNLRGDTIRLLPVPSLFRPDQKPDAGRSSLDSRAIAEITFSRSGRRFAAAVMGGSVIVGTWAAEPRIDDVVPISAGVTSVGFSAEEDDLYVGSMFQGLFRVPLRVQPLGGRPFAKTDQPVVQIAVDPSPIRNLLAATGYDAFKFFDRSTGSGVGPALLSRAIGLGFSNDARSLFATTDAGDLYRLDMSFRPLVARACSLIDPGLSSQATTFLSGTGASPDACNPRRQ